MSEKEIQELEDILIPFALKSLGILPMGRKFKLFFEWLVRAYIRCLFNITDEIHLNEITTVVIAEAYFMDDVRVFSMYGGYIKQFTALGNQFAAGEIHKWFIHLQELGKLPGVYNRFSGKFRIK